MAAIHGRFTRSQILIQNGNGGSDQSVPPPRGAVTHSVSSALRQVGKLIVWISMAILLSTLLLSTAMNC